MRISELYEDKSHNEKLHGEIMNVLMMFLKSGVTETDIQNIISELDKVDVVATEDDIREYAEQNDNLSVNQDGQVVLSVSDSDLGDERPDIEDEREYDVVSDKAKEATKKRMK